MGLVEDLISFLQSALPSYTWFVAGQSRSIRIYPPAGVIRVGEKTTRVFTLGYSSVYEELSVEIRLYRLTGGDIKSAIAQLYNDVDSLIRKLMELKTISGYIIAEVERADISEHASRPGLIGIPVSLRLQRVVM